VTEPVTLAEARAQVNIIDTGDTTFDTFLTSLIAPARAYVENQSRLFWVASSRSETFGLWGDDRCLNHYSYLSQRRDQFLEIYRAPIASVDGVTYGPNGNDTAYTGFVAPVGRFPLRIYPNPNAGLPLLNQGDLITVNYTSGALSATSEEYLIGKRAMLLLIGHWFENRESVIAGTRAASVEVTQTVSDLLDTLRPPSAY
jgi:hypothetical protein